MKEFIYYYYRFLSFACMCAMVLGVAIYFDKKLDTAPIFIIIALLYLVTTGIYLFIKQLKEDI